ncbi:hypothetical protein UlMin_041747 [Ulmus minor]
MGVKVAADLRRNLGVVKEKLLEKLSAASVPADALDNTRHFLESVVKDVTGAAHGLTKEALLRIKTHLVDLFPSLSPTLTSKMVDEAETEANNNDERPGNYEMMNIDQSTKPFISSKSKL